MVYALPLANYPVDGAYELTARATDAVGNSSTRTVSFVIDRIGPTAQALSATNGGTTVGRMQQGDVLAGNTASTTARVETDNDRDF